MLVADPHPLFRRAVAQTIGACAQLELVADVADGHDALSAIQELEPDAALLDIVLTGLDGRAVLNAVRRDRPATKIIFLSAHLDSDLAYDMVADGADGYVSKETEPDELCGAIVAVVDGQAAFGPEIQTGLAHEIRLRRPHERPVLSPRERQVLGLVGDGFSAPQIAKRLYISPATVRTHLSHAYGRLGVSDRAAAVRKAMRRGLLE